MKTIDIFVPVEDYMQFISRFEDTKTAIDALSVAVESRVRSHRSLLIRELIEKKERIKITIPVKEYLLPYLNEYCVIKGLSKVEFITKVMKGKSI